MSAAPVTRARAVALIGDALHRYWIATRLQELHRSGAQIAIWRSGGPVRLGERGQWHCRIRRPGHAEVHVTLCRKPQADVVAQAIQAVTT